jgi:hypothetical protein
MYINVSSLRCYNHRSAILGKYLGHICLITVLTNYTAGYTQYVNVMSNKNYTIEVNFVL